MKQALNLYVEQIFPLMTKMRESEICCYNDGPRRRKRFIYYETGENAFKKSRF